MPAVFHLSLTLLSCHDRSFVGSSFHASSSTVRLKCALMSGWGFEVFAVLSQHVVGPFTMASAKLLPPSSNSGWPTLYGIIAHGPSLGDS